MRSILKQIISLSLLSLFLMANMGFALIHHSCHDCSSDSKELQLFVLAHSHSEQNECFIDQCSMNNHEECACNDLDKHQEECQVEVNRLTTPFITAEKNIQVLKTDDFSVDYAFFSKAFENQNLHLRTLFSSIPNLKPTWGIDLLIIHSIFRL